MSSVDSVIVLVEKGISPSWPFALHSIIENHRFKGLVLTYQAVKKLWSGFVAIKLS